jgi:hypothetical protein
MTDAKIMDAGATGTSQLTAAAAILALLLTVIIGLSAVYPTGARVSPAPWSATAALHIESSTVS